MPTNPPEKYNVFICPVAVGANKNPDFLRQIENAKQEGAYFYVLIERGAVYPKELYGANVRIKQECSFSPDSQSLEGAINQLIGKINEDIPSFKGKISPEYIKTVIQPA